MIFTGDLKFIVTGILFVIGILALFKGMGGGKGNGNGGGRSGGNAGGASN